MTITAKIQICPSARPDHVIMSYFFPILSLIWGMLLHFSCMHIATFHRAKPVLPMFIPQFGLGHMEDQQDGLLWHYIDLFSQVEITPAASLAALTAFAWDK
jgi:hypothetical protein